MQKLLAQIQNRLLRHVVVFRFLSRFSSSIPCGKVFAAMIVIQLIHGLNDACGIKKLIASIRVFAFYSFFFCAAHHQLTRFKWKWINDKNESRSNHSAVRAV